jgi:hypothetical protein
MGLLLAGATTGSDAAAELERRAAKVSTQAALASLWFQSLDEADGMKPAVDLVRIYTASTAELQVKEAVDARITSNMRMWKTTAKWAVGGGMLAFAWWFGAQAWGIRFQTREISLFDIVFMIAAPIWLVSVMFSIDRQTARRF